MSLLTKNSCCPFLVFWLFSLLALQAGEVSKVTVHSVGSGKTRDGALVDACRLAVAQVHGSRVVGALLKTNEMNKHDISLGPTFEETRDATTLTFQGLLLNYKVLADKPPKNANSLWSVSIDADVLTSVPDRFSGRIAIVTPSLEAVKKKMGGSVNLEKFPEEVSKAINNWFANDSHFVLLERGDEAAINAELARASSGNSATSEKSKLQAQKVADVMILFQGGEIKYSETSTQFKLAGNVYRCEASTTMTIKAVDVATKGEIGRVTLDLKSDKKSSRSQSQSRSSALHNLGLKVKEALPICGLDILSALDVTRLKISAGGNISILSPSQPLGLSKIKKIEIWTLKKNETSSITKVGTFNFDAAEMKLEIEESLKIDFKQVFSFRPVTTSN